jgi:hypothetical protein
MPKEVIPITSPALDVEHIEPEEPVLGVAAPLEVGRRRRRLAVGGRCHHSKGTGVVHRIGPDVVREQRGERIADAAA